MTGTPEDPSEREIEPLLRALGAPDAGRLDAAVYRAALAEAAARGSSHRNPLRALALGAATVVAAAAIGYAAGRTAPSGNPVAVAPHVLAPSRGPVRVIEITAADVVSVSNTVSFNGRRGL